MTKSCGGGYNRLEGDENMNKKEKKRTIKIDDFTACQYMGREPDPDPNNWFEDDNQKFVCRKSGKILSSGNRPYENQPIPADCPELEA